MEGTAGFSCRLEIERALPTSGLFGTQKIPLSPPSRAMTAACASSGPHGATSPLAKLSGLVWPGHGQLGVPHAHGLPAYPPHDLQSPRQRSARHPAWADHEWDVFNRDVAPEPPRWALTGGVGEMRRDAGIAGLPAPSLPSMDPNNAWAAEFDTYSNVSSGPSVRGPPETRRLVGVPVVDDAAWSAEFAAAEMAAGYREFFEEDDDEYSQEVRGLKLQCGTSFEPTDHFFSRVTVVARSLDRAGKAPACRIFVSLGQCTAATIRTGCRKHPGWFGTPLGWWSNR